MNIIRNVTYGLACVSLLANLLLLLLPLRPVERAAGLQGVSHVVQIVGLVLGALSILAVIYLHTRGASTGFKFRPVDSILQPALVVAFLSFLFFMPPGRLERSSDAWKSTGRFSQTTLSDADAEIAANRIVRSGLFFAAFGLYTLSILAVVVENAATKK